MSKERTKTQTKAKAKQQGKHGKWKWLLLLFLAFCLLLSGVTLWFSFEPPQLPERVKFFPEDLRNQSQIMQQLMEMMFKKNAPEVYVLKATPAQLNSLLKIGFPFQTKKFSLQKYHLHIAPDGAVRFRYGHDTEMRWLHGGVLPIGGKVKFSKNGNVLDAHFQSLSAGILPLPESVGKYFFNRFLSRYGSTREFRFFMECVQSLQYDREQGCFFLAVRTRMLRQIL